MSNENPFVAPGDDGSAPLQAPPIDQNQVPAFGAAGAVPPAQASGATPAATGWPVAPGMAPTWPVGYAAGVPTVPPQRPGRGLPIAMIALAGVYVLLCLVEIFALAHRASLANQLLNDPESVTLDQADSADNMVNGLSIAAIAVFIGAIIVLVAWQRSLRRLFSYPGQYQALLRESGYVLFRIVWVILLFLSVFLRGNGTSETPQDVISHDHLSMAYFGARVVLGLLLIFLSVRLMRATERAVTLAQRGYSVEAVNFLQP